MGEEQTEIPGFLKISGEPEKTEPKLRRTAKFLILIGSERAAKILSMLPADQVEGISREISAIKSIGAEESRAVLEEFGSILAPSGFPVSEGAAKTGILSPEAFAGLSGPEGAANPAAKGGIDAARKLLYAAFGPEKGEQLLVRAAPEAKPNPFDFLEDFSGDQLALLFKEEPAAAAALVFSRLPPPLSAQALSHFTGEKKLQIVKGIARQNAVPPEVLEQVAGALREKARHIAKDKEDSTGFNGMEALAAILKSADSGFGEQILKDLEAEDPDLSKTLKDRIYTLSDLLEASDLPLQKKLASMNDKEIIILLKARTGSGESAAFRDKILRNLSQGRRGEILEEEGIVGFVPRKEVDAAAAAFLSWFRKSREEGSLLMMDDKDLVI